MNWLFFAISAPALYTCVNYVDKYLISGREVDYRALPIYSGITAMVLGLLLWIAGGFPLIEGRMLAFSLLSGVFSVWGAVLYFKGIARSAASQVIILLQMMPVFVLALSWLFLNERINPAQLGGFFVVILAAVALIAVMNEGGLKNEVSRNTFLLILGSDILLAISVILLKPVVDAYAMSVVLPFQNWGYMLGSLTLILFSPKIRTAFTGSMRQAGGLLLTAVFFNETLYLCSRMLNAKALSLAPASLVTAVSSTQVFFGLLFGWGLTLAAPAVFREDLSRSGLTKEALLAGLMFFGLWLIR